MKQEHNCKDELRGFQIKATPARVAVLGFLESVKEPADVNTILNYLEKNNLNVDPATIFRMMNLFVQKGIAHQVQFQENKTRYELLTKEDHHHLICNKCGNIEDISDNFMKEFEKEISIKKKFLVKSHSLEFFGLCKNCQS